MDGANQSNSRDTRRPWPFLWHDLVDLVSISAISNVHWARRLGTHHELGSPPGSPSLFHLSKRNDRTATSNPDSYSQACSSNNCRVLKAKQRWVQVCVCVLVCAGVCVFVRMCMVACRHVCFRAHVCVCAHAQRMDRTAGCGIWTI